MFRSRAPFFFCLLFFLPCFVRVFRRPFLGVFSAPCACGLFGAFGCGAFGADFSLSRPFGFFFPVSFDFLFCLVFPFLLIFCFVWCFLLLLLFPFVCFLWPHTHVRKPTPFWETTGSGFSPGPRGSVPPGRPLRPRVLETPRTGKLYTLVLKVIMPQGHLLCASARLRHGRWTIAAFAFFLSFPFPLPVSRFLASLLRLG